MIFNQMLISDSFPPECKKGSIACLDSQKTDKENLKNYLPVSLFSISGKIFKTHLHVNV